MCVVFFAIQYLSSNPFRNRSSVRKPIKPNVFADNSGHFFLLFFTYAGVFPPLNEITQAFVCFKLVYFFSGGLEIAQDGIIPWIRGFPWLFLGSILHTHTNIGGTDALASTYMSFHSSEIRNLCSMKCLNQETPQSPCCTSFSLHAIFSFLFPI